MTHGLHLLHERRHCRWTKGRSITWGDEARGGLVVRLPCCQPDTAVPFLFSAQSCPHLTLPLSMPIQLTWLGFQIPLFLSTTSHFLKGRISRGVTLNEASKVEQAGKQVPQLGLVMYECNTKITW